MTIAYGGHGNGEPEIHCIERSSGEKAMAASQFPQPCRDCLAAAMEDAKAGVSVNICMCFLFPADADVCGWQFSTQRPSREEEHGSSHRVVRPTLEAEEIRMARATSSRVGERIFDLT